MSVRSYFLVEGQTEEAFVNKLLVPHLGRLGFDSIVPVVVATKRPAAGGKFRGGITSWTKLHDEIRRLTQDQAALVTTMVDFYGLPKGTPGLIPRELEESPQARVHAIETAIHSEIDAANFLPYIMLHEFEALIYADPAVAADHFGSPLMAKGLRQDLAECGEPELVDNGQTTSPSKRIAGHAPGYVKTTDGPSIAADIGLENLRSACPHFGSWIAAIEVRAVASG